MSRVSPLIRLHIHLYDFVATLDCPIGQGTFKAKSTKLGEVGVRKL